MKPYLVVLGNKNRETSTRRQPDYTDGWDTIDAAKRDISNSNDVWQNGACVIRAEDYSVVVPPNNIEHPAFRNNTFLTDAYDFDQNGKIEYYIIVKFDSLYQYYAGDGSWTTDESEARYYIHPTDANKVLESVEDTNRGCAVFTRSRAPLNVETLGDANDAPATVGPEPQYAKVETLRNTSKYAWVITLESGLFLFLDEDDCPKTEIEDAFLFNSIDYARDYKPNFGSVPGSVTLLEVKTSVTIQRVE